MKGPAVVVTGVSTGIGLATTQTLISRDFHVFGSVRKQHDAERLQAEWGPDCFTPLLFDVTDAAAIAKAAAQVQMCFLDDSSVCSGDRAGL